MREVEAADAARNNAAWCDAVCSAHGRPGIFFDSHWIQRAPAPWLYPNLVTLDSAVEPAMAAVREIDATRPGGGWAVKDSFAVLPLAPAGFRVLFDAEWIVRPASTASRRVSVADSRWSRVRSEAELAAWEAAWGESLGGARVLLPELLLRDEIAILGARDDRGEIRAGVALNRTGPIVGLSNFFAAPEQRAALRAECIDAAAATFPDLALVGYETGQDLAECQALGFSSRGPLRVWARET